jgi:hypothetical protein
MVTKSTVDPKTFTTDYVKSDFDEMSFLGNPHIDALVSSIQAIGGELWSCRRRLHVIEAMMEKNIPVSPASIQAYMPTAEEDARWKVDRDRLVGGIYAPFLRADALSFPSKATQGYDPHTEPATGRRAPFGVSKDAVTKATPVPANIAGPMLPAR